MNLKKKIAAAAAVLTAFSAAVVWQGAVYAENSDSYGIMTQEYNQNDLPATITADEYIAMSAEQQAYYVKFNSNNWTVSGSVLNSNGNAASVVYNGGYVQKGTELYIHMPMEFYVGRDIIVNGTVLHTSPSGDNLSNFGGSYIVSDSAVNIYVQLRDQLTDYEKQNFVPITSMDNSFIAVRSSASGDITGRYQIIEGDYLNKNAYYNIAYPMDMLGNDGKIYLCGSEASYIVNSEDHAVVAGYRVNSNAVEFTAVTDMPEVISSSEYDMLTSEKRSLYVKYTEDNCDAHAYCNEYQLVNGDHVKRTTRLYISAPMEKYVGNDILINGSVMKANPSGDDYNNFGWGYVVGDEDIHISMQPKTGLTEYERKNFVPITRLGDGISVYRQRSYDDGLDFYVDIEQGDHINRNATYTLRVPMETLGNGELLVCGNPVEYEVNDDNEAQYWGFKITDAVTEFTAEIRPAQPDVISSKTYNSLTASEKAQYAKYTEENGYAHAYSGEYQLTNDDYVKKGSSIYISSVMEKYVGKDILVNGKVFQTYPSGDNCGNFGSYYTVNDSAVNVSMQPRAQLTDYEMQNFVPVASVESGFNIKRSDPEYEFVYDYYITEGDYLNRNAYYNIFVPMSILGDSAIKLCDVDQPYYVNGDNDAVVWYYQVPSYSYYVSEFNACIGMPDFISKETYNSYSADRQSKYGLLNMEGSGLYMEDFNGSFVENGCYARKGAPAYLACKMEKYVGKDIVVNGEIISVDPSGDDFYNFGTGYTFGDSDVFNIALQSRTELTDYEKENFVPVTELDGNVFIYRHEYQDYKTIDLSMRIEKGDHLNRNAMYAIRVPMDILGSRTLTVCGKAVGYNVNDSNEAQIWDYTLPGDITAFTAEMAEVKPLTDNATKITVVPEDIIPSSATISVTATDAKDTLKNAVCGYDIGFMSGSGKEIEPGCRVKVSIPVPAGKDGSKVKVYRRDANGEFTDMKAALDIDANMLVFTADSSGEYILTSDEQSVISGDANGDGKITAVDLVLTKRYVNQMITDISPAADMNGDGKVSTVDYVLLKRLYYKSV